MGIQKKRVVDIYGDQKDQTTVARDFYSHYEDSSFMVEELVGGDESFQEAKWQEKVRQPLSFDKIADNNIPAPKAIIELEYCYGYRVK